MKKKPCNGCPFACTEESDIIQNYGCLPSAGEIFEAYHTKNEAWMCHSDTTRVCKGLINSVDNFKLEGKIITTELNCTPTETTKDTWKRIKRWEDQ